MMNTCQSAKGWIGVVFALFVFQSHSQGANRVWRDATGDFTLEAELVQVKDGNVKLKKADGSTVVVAITKLSSDDQQHLENLEANGSEGGEMNVSLTLLTGKPEELSNDDGKAVGKKSFPRGIASAFESPGGTHYLSGIKVHGSRYGSSRAPKEDFVVTLCQSDFKPIAEFKFPYSKFARSSPKWVTLRVKPTKVPKDFVICLNFNPTSTKGVFVSHDTEGKSLVGLPNKAAGSFTAGDWMLRALVDKLR